MNYFKGPKWYWNDWTLSYNKEGREDQILTFLAPQILEDLHEVHFFRDFYQDPQVELPDKINMSHMVHGAYLYQKIVCCLSGIQI